MAKKYIQIENKSDIDTSKITVASIDHRYIDKNGQRYATRFNIRSHKIEIVAIALGSDEVLQARLKKRTDNKGDEDTIQQDVPQGRLPKPEWIIKLGLTASDNFDVRSFFPLIESESAKFSERIRGIISNIKSSDVFESSQTESGKDFILELTTFYDREIQENLNQSQNLVVEFTRFPKPPSNYYIHLDRKQKLAIESLEENDQMEYFKAYMIGTKYLKALEACLQLIKLVKDQVRLTKVSNLPLEKKAFFDNALEANDFVEASVHQETQQVIAWLEQARVF